MSGKPINQFLRDRPAFMCRAHSHIYNSFFFINGSLSLFVSLEQKGRESRSTQVPLTRGRFNMCSVWFITVTRTPEAWARSSSTALNGFLGTFLHPHTHTERAQHRDRRGRRKKREKKRGRETERWVMDWRGKASFKAERAILLSHVIDCEPRESSGVTRRRN